MKRTIARKNIGQLFFLLSLTPLSYAGIPSWTFTPLTPTTLSVPSNDTAIVQYVVTNQSSRIHTLKMQPIQGITQLSTGLGVCGNSFVLPSKTSCTLSLQVNGSQLKSPISDGPIVCEQGSPFQCYRPAPDNILNVKQASPITQATVTVTGSPLSLTTNGPTGTLTINNTSLIVSATNITSDFTGTSLDGNVTETGNSCANVAPQSSCSLEYTPGSTVVSQTNFPIQGSNTNAVTAAIQIDAGTTIDTVSPTSGPSSGGTSVMLIGNGFTGATGVLFNGIAATSVNVVNSTLITAVTPAHPIGSVDVTIDTPSGDVTKVNAYTYATPTVGQSAYGGTIACLNGGLNNLIAATADASNGIDWGGFGTATGATSVTDGAINSTTIVTTLGSGSPYAAALCNNYEVDSQGNTPCEPGNTCYSDWYLPAGNNAGVSGQLNCLYINQIAIGGFTSNFYWSSTESSSIGGWVQNFISGIQGVAGKNSTMHVRCVRGFTP